MSVDTNNVEAGDWVQIANGDWAKVWNQETGWSDEVGEYFTYNRTDYKIEYDSELITAHLTAAEVEASGLPVGGDSLHQWMNDNCVFARYDAIRNEWHTWNDGNGDKFDKGNTLRESLKATMQHWAINDPLPDVSDSEIVDYLDGMDNKIDYTNTGFVWAWKGRLRSTVIAHMEFLEQQKESK